MPDHNKSRTRAGKHENKLFVDAMGSRMVGNVTHTYVCQYVFDVVARKKLKYAKKTRFVEDPKHKPIKNIIYKLSMKVPQKQNPHIHPSGCVFRLTNSNSPPEY